MTRMNLTPRRRSPRRAIALVLAAVIVALLGLAGLRNAQAAPAVDPFLAGNTAAAAGDHATAAAAFEQAISRHGWSANTLLALGNAYEGAGQHGRAILAYQRARLLAPRDAAIAANLAHVRESAGLSAPAPSQVERVVGRLSADEWTWLGLAGGGLACLGVVGLAWSVQRRSARVAVVAGTLTAAIAGAAALQVAPPIDDAVIVAGEVARISPFAGAEAAFTAPEGETVRIEQQRGDYVYVRDGERSGWLPRSAVERVVPAGA